MDEGLVEKRRGLGMFVCEGAFKNLVTSERDKFLSEEWPATLNRVSQLGLDIKELFKLALEKESKSS